MKKLFAVLAGLLLSVSAVEATPLPKNLQCEYRQTHKFRTAIPSMSELTTSFGVTWHITSPIDPDSEWTLHYYPYEVKNGVTGEVTIRHEFSFSRWQEACATTYYDYFELMRQIDMIAQEQALIKLRRGLP